MGKIEKWHLLLSYCKYLDKSFTEMFFSSFLSAVYILVDLGHMTKMADMPIYGKNLEKAYSPEPVGRLQ